MGVTPGFVCARLDAGQRRCPSAPLFAISGPPPARLVWASGSYSPCLTSTAEDSSSRRRRRAACGISPEDEKQQFAHHEAASHRATKLPSTPCWFLSPHHLDYTSKKTPWGGGGQNSPRAVLLVAVVVVEGGGDDERKRSKRRRRTAIEGFEVFHHLHPFPSKYRTPPKTKKS